MLFPLCVCACACAPAQALAAVQLEALTADGQRLTAWPSSSSTREAKRLTHGRLRGAYLQLPAPEATALVLRRRLALALYIDPPPFTTAQLGISCGGCAPRRKPIGQLAQQPEQDGHAGA